MLLLCRLFKVFWRLTNRQRNAEEVSITVFVIMRKKISRKVTFTLRGKVNIQHIQVMGKPEQRSE